MLNLTPDSTVITPIPWSSPRWWRERGGWGAGRRPSSPDHSHSSWSRQRISWSALVGLDQEAVGPEKKANGIEIESVGLDRF